MLVRTLLGHNRVCLSFLKLDRLTYKAFDRFLIPSGCGLVFALFPTYILAPLTSDGASSILIVELVIIALGIIFPGVLRLLLVDVSLQRRELLPIVLSLLNEEDYLLHIQKVEELQDRDFSIFDLAKHGEGEDED